MTRFDENPLNTHSWGWILAIVVLALGAVALAAAASHFVAQRNQARRELAQERTLVNQLNSQAPTGPQVQTNSWLYPIVSTRHTWAAIVFFEGQAGDSAYVSFAVVGRGFEPNTEYEVELGGCEFGKATFQGNGNLASPITDSSGGLQVLEDELAISDSVSHGGTLLRLRSKDGRVLGILRGPFSRAAVLSPSAQLCPGP